jgi:dUTP pyrophosphatase
VGKVYELQGEGALDFDNSKRSLCEYVEVPPEDGAWTLPPGVYHCAMNERIDIPLDLCALLLPRSSALACGLTIHTALWDPGYRGRSFMHTVARKRVVIYEGARLAQMVFLPVTGKADAYRGSYLDEDVLTRGVRGKQENLDGWKPNDGN